MGTFTSGEDLPVGTDCLFYEGLHGAMVTEGQYRPPCRPAHRRVPTINLEWIQKLRDTRLRGYSKTRSGHHPAAHAITCTHRSAVLAPHINFQRVPVVDTSTPLLAGKVDGVIAKGSRGVDRHFYLLT